MDGKVEVKVGRVPVRQGRGAVGYVAAVCKGPVVPLAGRPSHPTDVVTDGLEEGYVAGVLILCKPGHHLPQEEGGRVSLMAGGVDLLRYAGRSEFGGSVHRVNPIWVQNGLVFSGKRVCLWAGKKRMVRANCISNIRLSTKASHDEGPR